MRVFDVSTRRLSWAVGALVAIWCVLGVADSAYAESGVVPGSFTVTALNRDGTIDSQAGSHPYEYVVAFAFNEDSEKHVEGSVRDVNVDLPPGLVGDPTAVPRCDREDFEGSVPSCSAATQLGVIEATTQGTAPVEATLPLYSIVPPRGVPATLGGSVIGFNVLENASVRTGSDNGISVDTNNIPSEQVVKVREIVWGNPADPAHNPERTCSGGEAKLGCASGVPSRPFLTLPTSCASPLQADLSVDFRDAPGVLLGSEPAFSEDAGGNPAPLSGCERLAFEPSLKVSPDTSFADSPAGLTASVNVGQAGLEAPEGLSSADIKNTTVVLPEGVAINPGQAAGLQACPRSASGIGSEGPASCPNASQVGTVHIKTPLLEEELEGDVYVLPSNPPDLELLVAASDPVAGIYLKLVGHVHLDAVTGRLTTTFSETPQLPFTSFRLSFSGGAQAALTTPTRCGVYTTQTDFTPWSTPFTPDDLTSDSFAITAGTNGGPCPPAQLPFTPSMIAGSTTDQAAGYTDFSLLLTRGDDQQRISGLQFKTPEGLLGMISKVPLCQEPQASEGACASSSQIGHTIVESGPGPYPLVVPQPGQPPAPIYLTGGYKGAPYGLSIVVPLVVGPFTLQTQVVRARIEVDPHTSRLTVTTDPLPTLIDGVPADLRTIDAVIDRPGFMFNPTNCAPQAFTGTATSTEGATAPLQSSFQVGSCQSLKFAPKFSVSTSGKTSKANGASLTAKLSYPNAPQGTQANITRVKVDLPKQLPSRLTTLQKACTNAQFETNPAGCPAASKIGMATVTTSLLPVPLVGPAIFVSHGGEAFPSLTMVLQGDNVTVDLVGTTFISKAGITSTTFKTVPDVPFNTFTLTLPQGKYSALAANGNLCKAKLAMPTEFLAQNGAVINQSTKISVTGCPKVVRHVRKKNHRKKK